MQEGIWTISRHILLLLRLSVSKQNQKYFMAGYRSVRPGQMDNFCCILVFIIYLLILF